MIENSEDSSALNHKQVNFQLSTIGLILYGEYKHSLLYTYYTVLI